MRTTSVTIRNLMLNLFGKSIMMTKGNSGDAWGNGTSDDSFMGNNLAHYFGPTLKGENIGGGWYKMQPSPYLIKEFISEQRPEGSDSKWE